MEVFGLLDSTLVRLLRLRRKIAVREKNLQCMYNIVIKCSYGTNQSPTKKDKMIFSWLSILCTYKRQTFGLGNRVSIFVFFEERVRGRRESERRGTYLLKESLALEGNGGDSLWELAAEGPEPRPQVLLIQRGIHV